MADPNADRQRSLVDEEYFKKMMDKNTNKTITGNQGRTQTINPAGENQQGDKKKLRGRVGK